MNNYDLIIAMGRSLLHDTMNCILRRLVSDDFLMPQSRS
jgi:hypothetical protein